MTLSRLGIRLRHSSDFVPVLVPGILSLRSALPCCQCVLIVPPVLCSVALFSRNLFLNSACRAVLCATEWSSMLWCEVRHLGHVRAVQHGDNHLSCDSPYHQTRLGDLGALRLLGFLDVAIAVVPAILCFAIVLVFRVVAPEHWCQVSSFSILSVSVVISLRCWAGLPDTLSTSLRQHPSAMVTARNWLWPSSVQPESVTVAMCVVLAVSSGFPGQLGHRDQSAGGQLFDCLRIQRAHGEFRDSCDPVTPDVFEVLALRPSVTEHSTSHLLFHATFAAATSSSI